MANTHFKNQTLQKYLDQLASREPVPGGGSAAAVTSALGAGLISMVVHYSLGKGKSQAVEKRMRSILKSSEAIRKRLLELSEIDSQAYLNLMKSWKKGGAAARQAKSKARQAPQEICRLSTQAVALAPFLVLHGNPHLLSDVQVAIELLLAGFSSAAVMVKINQ